MNDKNDSIYKGGLYGCLKKDLEDVIKDIDNNEDLFVVSVKTMTGMTIYSLPGTLTKIKNVLEDIVSSIENREVHMIGTTYVNTEHIITARICKYIPKEGRSLYD